MVEVTGQYVVVVNVVIVVVVSGYQRSARPCAMAEVAKANRERTAFMMIDWVLEREETIARVGWRITTTSNGNEGVK